MGVIDNYIATVIINRQIMFIANDVLSDRFINDLRLVLMRMNNGYQKTLFIIPG